MSWKMEVETVGSHGEWNTNNCAYETEAEALEAGSELMSRWRLVIGYRAVQSDQPVNYWFDFEREKPRNVRDKPPVQ